MFQVLLEADTMYRTLIGVAAMALLFSALLISFITSQRKKLKYHKDLQEANEREQKILAEQNALLEQKVKERTAELSEQKEALITTLDDLRSTQLQLVQREKMASLGELTAGIAHEIQNPLNFVNNFSEINTELLSEIRELVDKEDISEDAKQNIGSLVENVNDNLNKINVHGKRADAIVKGMLQHSRTNSGEREPTDINALADEYLRLSYHGLRAKDKSFNSALHTELDPQVGKIKVIPQDIGRVLINLFNNSFYSVNEKKKAKGAGYDPLVSLTTRKMGNKVEIKIRDNGSGIPQKFLDKIYQPFFTTKPSGQGTGLGLSLSYDIIKAHQGDLKVDTVAGEYAEFTILL